MNLPLSPEVRYHTNILFGIDGNLDGNASTKHLPTNVSGLQGMTLVNMGNAVLFVVLPMGQCLRLILLAFY